ncbi:MAG: NAD(P)/FAD-dependent oxidoreductase [Tissierellia bacterium]|nr:NAD(P)/FAD-dependent oxidoreductase [Tissierellia bacterium]
MRICIIGAGVSGLFSAIHLGYKHEIHLFEKNKEMARKLLLTGNGRCNLTNALYGEDFLDNIVRNKKFFYSSFYHFNNFDTIDFFNKLNVETYIDDNLKVFPKTNKAKDIKDVLVKEVQRKNNVAIHLNEEVIKIKKDNLKFIIKTIKNKFEFEIVIVATGGMSYKKTGSNGFGYKIAKEFSHNIVDLKPALTSIRLKESLPFKALSLKNIKILAKTDEFSKSFIGDLLISNDLLTGPVIFKISSYINRIDNFKLYMDIFYDFSYEKLDQKLLSLMKIHKNSSIKNILKLMVNESLSSYLLEINEIDKKMKINQLKREDRIKIIDSLKQFEFPVKKLSSLEFATVTSGGVDVLEINPKNMQSKIVDNLFFIGEVLDLDALTGGFNLQIAFSTAFQASDYIRRFK